MRRIQVSELIDSLRVYVLPQTNGCWRWMGKVDPNGYGRTGKGWAHREVYEALVGPIPEGEHLDHLCRVPLCVNPLHLEPVTPRENFVRSDHPWAVLYRLRLATNQCKNGHDLTEVGAVVKGHRYCKACRREYQRAQYAAQVWPSMIAKQRRSRFREVG